MVEKNCEKSIEFWPKLSKAFDFFRKKALFKHNKYRTNLLLCIRRKKGQTTRRIANSRLLTFSPSCFDFFIMIWVAVRIASNKLKSRKGEEECEEEENRKCNCIIENLEKRVGNKNSFLVISLFYKVLLSRLVCYSNLCVSKSKRVPRIMLCWWGQLFGSLITSISPFVP